MDNLTGNKAIARNTILLYFRMLVTMIVSLYTSRVVLRILGVDDYGIYQAVGGIVGFLSFINNALSSGTSRFITYGLGAGDKDRLKKIFSTTLTTHIALAIIIVILAETIGLWFLYNKMVIAPERFQAAVITYHLSIVTAFISLTQVPFNACIIAHEKMDVYAYVSIVEVSLKLLIVYLLTIGNVDKLKLYSILLCGIQISIMLFYRFYCRKHFEESRGKLLFEKNIFKEVAGFSGWSMISASAAALNGQGILILLNMFFSPAVVAARSISLQVNAAANQLVMNFQNAALPQIVKKYAAEDFEGSKTLLLSATKISFFLMLLICMPVCLTAETLLKLWLVEVPDYTVVFLQIVIVQSLFQVFDTSFYQALYAKGRLRENALISPTLVLLNFPIVYVLFKQGFSPVVLSWTNFITYAILGMIVKPFLIIKIVGYKWSEILSVYKPCIKVLLASSIMPITVYLLLNDSFSEILRFFIIGIISVISVLLCSWFWGLDDDMRQKVKVLIISKISKK